MESFVLRQGKNGIWYGTFPALTQAGIRHGVSTRLKGVSDHPFRSLNLGLHTGDNKDMVICNRQRFAAAVGIDFASIVTAEQIHGAEIAVVDREQAGRGASVYEGAVAGVDALITNCPELPLMLFFADCVPVLIADPVQRVVGISHAGWKGTAAKIAAQTVLKMAERFHTTPSDCIAAIGPSIGSCCYEVDQPVIDKLRAELPYWQSLISGERQNNKWMLDLWKANQEQLLAVGVRADNIHISQVCTACSDELFFSYRSEHGCTGRMGAVIQL